jgi:hypothetical protein
LSKCARASHHDRNEAPNQQRRRCGQRNSAGLSTEEELKMRGAVLCIGSLLILVLNAPPSAAQDPEAFPGEAFHVEFVTAWWQPKPALTIQTGQLAGAGITDFDFAEEFNLEHERFTDFRLVLKPTTGHKVRFSYLPMRYDQGATLVRPIQFNGHTYSGGAALDIKWSLWQLGYEWDFIRRERGFLGLLGEVKYNDIRATVRSVGRSDWAGSKAAVPTVGIIGRQYLHRNVAISGELSGLKVPGNAFNVSFWDFDISATASVSRHFGVEGGYRAVTANYAIDEDSGDLKMRGIYAALVSRF